MGLSRSMCTSGCLALVVGTLFSVLPDIVSAGGGKTGTTAAAAPVNVTVNGGTPTFTFDASATTTTFLLDVTLPPTLTATLDKVTVKKGSVRRDKQPYKVNDTFVFDRKLVDNGRPTSTLAITVNHIDTLRPGVYDITVLLANDDKTVFAPFNVSLTRPSVQLSVPAKQTVSVELLSVGGRVLDFGPKEWTFAPTSESVSTGLGHISADTFSLESDSTVVSTKLFKQSETTPVKDPPAVKVVLNPGAFPLGKTIGKVTLRGAALAAPQTFDVEVNTRLTPIWIVPLVLLGLVFGWLLRIHLQQSIDVAKARIAAADVLKPAVALKNTIADPTYRLAFDVAAKKLTDVLVGNDATKIQLAMTAFDTEMKDPTGKLNDGLVKARAQLDELGDASPTPPLPASLVAACQALRAQLDDAERLIAQKDATNALLRLGKGQKSFAEAMEQGSISAAKALPGATEAYAKLQTYLDNTTRQANADGLAWLNAKFARADYATTPGSTPKDLAGALNKWRKLGSERSTDIQSLAGLLVDDARALADAAIQAVSSDKVKAATARWRTYAHISVPSSDSPNLWTKPAVPLDDAFKADFQALCSAVAASQTDGGEAFVEAWSQGERLAALQALNPGAASKAPGQQPPRQAGIFKSISSVTNATDSTAALEWASRFSNFAPTPNAAPKIFTPQLDSPTGIEEFEQRTMGKLAKDSAWQLAGVIVVATWGSYAVFSGHFIGTAAELFGLFVWGFSVDLSVCGLTTLLSPYKPKSL